MHDASHFFRHDFEVVDSLSLGKLTGCPRFNSEIPANSFIAALVSVTTYRASNVIPSVPALNFNLLSVAILGFPEGYQVQPVQLSSTEYPADRIQYFSQTLMFKDADIEESDTGPDLEAAGEPADISEAED